MIPTKLFLEAVLPSQGSRFAFIVFSDGRPSQRAFAPGETDDLISYCRWANERKLGDAYFAVGGYLAPPGAELKRTAAMAQWHRSLRIDIDCGEGKPYPDKRAGAAALQAFMLQVGLPRPWLVDSGGGLHAYWAFTRDVPLQEWLLLASLLKATCATKALHADPTVTADAARVLRMPETVNRKRGEAREVRVLLAGTPADPDALQAVLRPLAGALPAVTVIAPAGDNDELSGGRMTPYGLRGVLTKCPGMAAQVRTGGAHVTEPLWKATLDLIHKADDPIDARARVARALSVGHPGFSEEGFALKWAQTQQQDYHPPTCARMASLGMPECERCPMRGKISSPLVLGRPEVPIMAPDAAVPPPPPRAVPPPPAGVSVVAPPAPQPMQVLGVFGTDGGPRIHIVDGPLTKALKIHNQIPHRLVKVEASEAEDGQPNQYWVQIGGYRWLHVERMLDSASDSSLLALTIDRHSDGPCTIAITQAHLTEARALSALFSGNGVHLTPADVKILQDKFMPEFMQQLQRVRAANRIAARCGWTDNLDGFVLGTSFYRADGVVEHIRPHKAAEYIEGFHAAGDPAQWRKAFELALSGGVDRQAVLALSLASPLMAFTGVDGVLLNAYSQQSGVGKSTLCDAALSIWGSPNKLRLDFRDTANATWQLATMTGNLPLVVDEFTNVEGRVLSEYVYTVTQGREKNRLSADARLRANSGRWCLPTIATANNSVLDKLQAYRPDAVAEAARVFELRLQPLQTSPDQLGEAKTLLHGLKTHYGHLGPQLVALILAKGPEFWRTAVAARIAKWDRDVALDASERFRSATAALIEVGALLGRAMGFDFDIEGITRMLRQQWEDQQAEFEMSRQTPEDFINSYLVEGVTDLVIFGGPEGTAITNQMMPRTIRGEVRGKHVMNGGFRPETVSVPQAAMRDYIRERNGNYKAFIEWAKVQASVLGSPVARVGYGVYLDGSNFAVRTPLFVFRASVLGTTQLVAANPVPPPAPALDAWKGRRVP